MKIPNLEVIRNHKLKRDREYNDQMKNDNNKKKQAKKKTKNKPQATKHYTDRTTRSQYKSERNSGTPEGSVVPAPHETPVVLLLNNMNIIL